MRNVKFAILGLASVGAITALSPSAYAMPFAPLAAQNNTVENVRWVCGPFRCFWRPNYYGAYGFYGGGPRFYGGRRYYGGWRGGGGRGWRRW